MSDYTCTYCGGELSYDDTFGLGIPFTSSFKEKGELWSITSRKMMSVSCYLIPLIPMNTANP
jgi:hypothetical protein